MASSLFIMSNLFLFLLYFKCYKGILEVLKISLKEEQLGLHVCREKRDSLS